MTALFAALLLWPSEPADRPPKPYVFECGGYWHQRSRYIP